MRSWCSVHVAQRYLPTGVSVELVGLECREEGRAILRQCVGVGLTRSVRAVRLFRRAAVLETHTL